ncbi:37 kDa salivary gland allergen Aed a 2-like [Culex pipiens pallens]|uniref:37 kDa salivary gland allergen Aed a 2-like n=1 Tax=Culex pipiens pallens TaxID=42434 RepID=UPI0019533AC1|nr:37 kDa salivary gland allergen Aed a 2-like [Culex pipiens pallens]
MKLVLLVVISFACAVTSTAWEPLSPEETLFIITRCQEDHFRHNLTKLKLWDNFVLPRDDVDTACYVKCIISMAEQFDNDTNSFKADNVMKQYEAFKSYTKLKKGDVLAYEKDLRGLGTLKNKGSKSFFNKYLPIYEKHKIVVNKLLLLDASIAVAIYKDNPDIKRHNESIFRHCEKKFFKPEDVKKLCNLRKTAVTDHPRLAEHEACLLRGLRYTRRDGSLNAQEILRDFHLVNITYEDEYLKEVVRNCSIEESTKDPAYLTCLYAHHELQGPMWKGTDYREIRSMNYFYLLRDPPEYDPKEIRMQVCAIDAEVGCVNGRECAED